MYYDTLDRAVLKLEKKSGWLLSAGIVAVLFMVAAAIYVRPAISCAELGKPYSQMAENPFIVMSGNYVGFRILTPLISYLVGLRGDLIIVTNLIFAAVLIGLVYLYFRRHAPRPGDALIAAAVITFSLVTLTTIFYGWHTDSLTYIIIFLMWWLRSKRPLFYILFFLGLVNRESIAFLVPWFAYLSYREKSSVWRWLADLLVGFGLTFGTYQLYREWMLSRGEIGFTFDYYIGPVLNDPLYWVRRAYPCQGLGFFTVFKALWIFPVVAVIHLWQRGNKSEVFSIALLLCCTWSQMLIAYDSSRMLTLGFMVMIISLKHLFEDNPFQFRRWAGFILLLNLFVPQLYTAFVTIETMRSTPSKIITSLILGRDAW